MSLIVVMDESWQRTFATIAERYPARLKFNQPESVCDQEPDQAENVAAQRQLLDFGNQ